MSIFDEIVKKNPVAARSLEQMKDVIKDLNDLRAAGMTRGSEIRPFRGRSTINEIKASPARRLEAKMTFDA